MLNTSADKVKTRQKKLEDAVLSKAKRFIISDAGEAIQPPPPSSVSDTPSNETKVSSSGAAKKRKPRHASEEGKKILQARAKARVQLEGFIPVKGSNKRAAQKEYDAPAEPLAKKSKKSKNKKKKKSKGQEAGQSQGQDRNPATDERQCRESLAYLQLWKGHRDHWKFEKLKQTWLLKNALKDGFIDDTVFTILLDYMSSIKGAAKVKTLQEMQEFVADFEKKFGRQGGDPNSVFSCVKPKEDPGEELRKEYERARQIIQTLSDDSL